MVLSQEKAGRQRRKETSAKPGMMWKQCCMVMLLWLVADYCFTGATAHPSPKIREGREHLHNNLVNHAVALDDINDDLPFASVRHLYSTHPNSVVHDAGKKAALLAEMQASDISARSNSSISSLHQSEFIGTDVVPPTNKFFLGAFTGAAIRALAGLAALAANKVCNYIDKAFGDDKNAGQIVGVAACYIGANVLGLYGLFSAGHNLYKLQQAGQRTAEIIDTVNEAFELAETVAGGVSKRGKTTTADDVHEMMKDEFLTHKLALQMAARGYKYEAAGLLSTIRPVSMKTKGNHTAHLWQDFHDGQIRKTHVLTRIKGQISEYPEGKRDVCENSNNEAGEDPQATVCASGANEGFTGVYDSFDMFDSENSYEVVDYGMGDSKYSDDVSKYGGDLMDLAGTSGLCIYPSVNNQTALTILSALEMGGQPSQTYAMCPSLS